MRHWSWVRIWHVSWAALVMLASITFPHNRLWSITLIVLASASFNAMLGAVAGKKVPGPTGAAKDAK